MKGAGLIDIGETIDGYTIFESGLARKYNPFLIVKDKKGKVIRVYLNEKDKFGANLRGVKLQGRYYKLKTAKYVYVVRGMKHIWIKK